MTLLPETPRQLSLSNFLFSDVAPHNDEEPQAEPLTPRPGNLYSFYHSLYLTPFVSQTKCTTTAGPWYHKQTYPNL